MLIHYDTKRRSNALHQLNRRALTMQKVTGNMPERREQNGNTLRYSTTKVTDIID